MINRLFLLVLISILSITQIYASTRTLHKPKTIVFYENSEVENSHSEIFQHLSKLGHQIKFSNVKEDTVSLKHYDKYLYDNIIVFSSHMETLGGGNINTHDLIDFVDNGGSLFLAASSEGISETHRTVASTYGVDFDENTSFVIDTNNFVDAKSPLYTSSTNTKPIISRPLSSTDSNAIIGRSSSSRSLLFRGIGQITARDTDYIRPIISGSHTSSSYNPEDNSVLAFGKDLSLITAVQTLSSSRIVYSGSLESLSNAFLNDKSANNREIMTNMLNWCFHHSGYLRAREPTHHSISLPDVIKPAAYKFKDDISFSVIVEEYNPYSNEWLPYVSDKVLFEAVMIDPYIRSALTYDSTKKTYGIDWRVPDIQGVYKFTTIVNQFKQPTSDGVSFIKNIEVVSVRPLRHDEYPRFELVTLPYYVSSFCALVAFFVFTVRFIYTK